MAPGHQPSPPPPAAILSPKFYLAHKSAVLNYTRFPVVSRPRWQPSDTSVPSPVEKDFDVNEIRLPDLDTEFNYYRVTNRWLYVFNNSGGKWTWIGEYLIDTSGFYHPVDMEKARDKERNKRPQPAKDYLELLSFPYQINGKQVYTGFFLSGTRLALQSIKKLENNSAWGFRPAPGDSSQTQGSKYALDYYDLNPALYDGAYYIPDKNGKSFLRVRDEMWYTISLNRMMQQLRDLAISWTTPAADSDPQTRKRTEIRCRKKLLAETIKQMMDHDPQDRLSLRDKFHPHPVPNDATSGEKVMSQWLKDYEATAAWWSKIVEEAADMLVRELTSKTMAFVTETYRVLEKVDPKGYEEDMPLFQTEFSWCMERIVETLIGVAWVDSVIKDPAHWINEYVLIQKPPEGVRYQVFRKSAAALLSIWSELPARYILIKGKTSVVTLVDYLTWGDFGTILPDKYRVMARDLILPGTTRIEVSSHWEVGADGWTPTGRRVVHSDIVVREGVDIVKDHRIEKAKKIADKVFLAIELLNLVIGIQSLLSKAGSQSRRENVWAAIGVLGSSLDAATAYGAIFGMSKKLMAKIGAVSALIDSITATRQALQLSDIGEISAAAAAGTIALGSALITMGYAATLLGGGTAWTGAGVVFGIVGAVMVAIGYIASLFASDNTFQMFILHSVWGARYGLDSGTQSWSEGSFSDWHESKENGLKHQIDALINLLAAFSITGQGWKVSIQLGLQTNQTKLYVQFLTIIDGQPQQIKVIVDLDNSETQPDGPADPNLLGSGGVIASFGSDHVELAPRFSNPPPRMSAPEDVGRYQNNYEMLCYVLMDYNGDGKNWIPSSRKPVHYRTKALSTAAAVSSAD